MATEGYPDPPAVVEVHNMQPELEKVPPAPASGATVVPKAAEAMAAAPASPRTQFRGTHEAAASQARGRPGCDASQAVAETARFGAKGHFRPVSRSHGCFSHEAPLQRPGSRFAAIRLAKPSLGECTRLGLMERIMDGVLG